MKIKRYLIVTAAGDVRIVQKNLRLRYRTAMAVRRFLEAQIEAERKAREEVEARAREDAVRLASEAEERARQELGMVKANEIFVQIVKLCPPPRSLASCWAW